MSDDEKDLEQLKLLFDYTKFHIGLYATVATIFGGLIATSDKSPLKFVPWLLFLSVIFICVAGLAGGLIASSIPGYGGYAAFWKANIRPYWWLGGGWRPETWTYIEHTAFWFAVVFALLSVGLKQEPFASVIYGI
jgi:hypothetical protein